MNRSGHISGAWLVITLALAAWAAAPGAALGTEILLKDGRVLSGKLAMITSLAEISQVVQPDGSGPLQLIVLLDDDLRRTFVSRRQVREVRQGDQGEIKEKFNIRQRVLRNGRPVKSVGPILRLQPFDEFGRRIFTMSTAQGPVDIIQGITEITPDWTKVEGISHVWDMRIGTSSIPRDILDKILAKQIDPKDLEQRKKIARFYLQSQRYEDAVKELEAVLTDFPGVPNIQEQLAPSIQALRQLAAQRLLAELKLRREAGQHVLTLKTLKSFPFEGVSGEILQAAREMIDQYEALEARRQTILKNFDQLLAKVDDTALRAQIEPVRKEIFAELNVNTLERMASFVQNMTDADLLPTERLSLAVSGWLLGAEAATVKLPVAISVYRVRQLVREYLKEPIKLARAKSFGYLSSEEGATPQLVAGMLAQMKPPVDTPAQDPEKPGYYELEVPGLPKEPPVRYLVQLPPEYDPLRRYPAIVTLQGAGITAENQLDWWAGAPAKGGGRSGQASRRGYIVIAPAWTKEHQKEYQYSAREHAAVLDCLRDACRRFAVDTDRVFLSGHSMGGDAAWDLGLAHPDLWAGVIPVVARSDRYCALYWENAQLVPFYFVCGELDGGKMTSNARDLDRYLKRGFNATVVEYLGRGHEDFYDEIQRLFDWMGRFRRDFFPREFTGSTMRPWDNFFWWVELAGLPPGSMVDPGQWPPPRGTQAVQVKASITANNGLYVRAGSSLVNVWLSPQMLDFSRRIYVTVNGRRMDTGNSAAEPNLQVLLEDVRTRADRQHPFWAKVQMATGRLPEER